MLCLQRRPYLIPQVRCVPGCPPGPPCSCPSVVSWKPPLTLATAVCKRWTHSLTLRLIVCQWHLSWEGPPIRSDSDHLQCLGSRRASSGRGRLAGLGFPARLTGVLPGPIIWADTMAVLSSTVPLESGIMGRARQRDYMISPQYKPWALVSDKLPGRHLTQAVPPCEQFSPSSSHRHWARHRGPSTEPAARTRWAAQQAAVGAPTAGLG